MSWLPKPKKKIILNEGVNKALQSLKIPFVDPPHPGSSALGGNGDSSVSTDDAVEALNSYLLSDDALATQSVFDGEHQTDDQEYFHLLDELGDCDEDGSVLADGPSDDIEDDCGPIFDAVTGFIQSIEEEFFVHYSALRQRNFRNVALLVNIPRQQALICICELRI
jgi:hypothetical protein